MSVGIVGSGPGVVAVEVALEDVGVETATGGLDAVVDEEVVVVVGNAGDAVFERTNERAIETGLSWVAVELGGMGGIPVVDAAVAGFDPTTGCYECLSGRVTANLDPETGPTADPPAHTERFAGAVAGHEVARHVAEDADIFGRVVAVPFTEREFLPLPNCVCGGEREGTLEMTHVDRDVEASLARAERALDERVGIVQDLGEAESFPVPYYLARTCDTAGFSDTSAARDAAGVAADWNAAFMKALGEALERYCAGIYRTEAFVSGPSDAVEGAVPLSEFVCRADPSPGADLAWVEGRQLGTDMPALLPAEFVYHPPPSKRYTPGVTTGLGLGNSTVGALLSGLYEVIERDAMTLSWYSTFDPLELDIADDQFDTLSRRARSEGLTVTPLLLTQDVDVPVVAVAVTRDEWPRFALGTDADLDVARAGRSALGEALQNWMELRGMGPADAADTAGAVGRYAEEPGPASEFITTDRTIPAATVGADGSVSGAAELHEVIDRLDEAGLDAYAVRTTTRDVEQLGFEAVRALVPAAQPLSFGEMHFGQRIERIPEALGFDPRPEREHHPFP